MFGFRLHLWHNAWPFEHYKKNVHIPKKWKSTKPEQIFSFKLGCTCQIRIGGSISVRQTGHSSSLDWRLKVHNIMRFCLTCRRQTPPPPASALWPPPAAAGWQQATPSWPRPPSCPPPPSPPPPKWTKTRPGMLEAWVAHLTLHEKLSLLGELLPEDSPSTKAAFSLQLKMKMPFFLFQLRDIVRLFPSLHLAFTMEYSSQVYQRPAHLKKKNKSVSVQHGRHSGSPGEWGDSGPPQAKAQCDAGHCQGEDIEGYLEILRDIVEAGIGILSRWEYWGMFRDFEEYFQGRKQYHVCKMLWITTCYGVTR